MKRVIIMGSPRSHGRSAHLAEMLFEASIDERPEDELFLVPVSEVEIGPCIGCGACRTKSEITFKNDDGEEVTELRHRCVFDDDMQMLYDLLDDADELVVVSPIYFSGTPAPMKCVLDRMQPYFWVTQWGLTKEEARALPKRPASLHVVGEGGDPHGFDPLIGEMKSSLACAGFRLERVFNWVGKIDESGEILAEATEIKLGHAQANEEVVHSSDAASRQRPKLDLTSGKKAHQEASRQKSEKKKTNQAGRPSQKKGKRRG